jgi:hypothetical protein
MFSFSLHNSYKLGHQKIVHLRLRRIIRDFGKNLKLNKIVTWGQHEDVESPEGGDVGVKHLPMCLQTK